MSRIASTFTKIKRINGKALIPFVTAGDPRPTTTVSLMHAMVKAGADMIELGVPFSDPMADGPVIQRASERALVYHTSLSNVLEMVAQFRAQDQLTPVILMGYLNPVEVMGYADFTIAAQKAGVDGVLLVDMPPEEADEYIQAAHDAELDSIFLIAPTSTADRIAKISALARGFVYYVSLKGVTGAATLDIASVEEKINQIRVVTDIPIGVGFGIKNAETAAQVSKIADAVVVGSAIVNIIERCGDDEIKIKEDVSSLIREMRDALDN
ncbi:MAG: tryptophan synthase subunit alpha [Gammaproteobacteria bacterium]